MFKVPLSEIVSVYISFWKIPNVFGYYVSPDLNQEYGALPKESFRIMRTWNHDI